MKAYLIKCYDLICQDKYKLMTMILAVVSFFYMLLLYLTPITNNDIWIQLKIGALIRQSGEIPSTILFAFGKAKDMPFMAHEWLTSVLFSFWFDWFGYTGLIILKFLLFSGLFVLVAGFCYGITKESVSAIVIAGVCLLVVNCRSMLRPEVMGYFCFMIQMGLLLKIKQKMHWKYLIAYIAVNIIWVNSHGSFLIGIGLPFVFIGGGLIDVFFKRDEWKEIQKFLMVMMGLGGLCLITSLINPFGAKMLEEMYHLNQNNYFKKIIFEWKPMFDQAVMKTTVFDVFLGFNILFVVILGFRFEKLKGVSWILIGIFLYLTLQSYRHVAFYALTGIYPLALMLSDLKENKNMRGMVFVFGFVCMVSIIYYSYNFGNMVGRQAGFYKTSKISDKALHFIEKENISGNVFNSYNLGGELIYHVYPKINVFIDSRCGDYGEKYMRFYMSMFQSDLINLIKCVAINDIEYMFLNKRDFNYLVKKGRFFSKFKDWKVIFKDGHLAVLSKKGKGS